MAQADYKIFYGKYPDSTPNVIPTAHIKTMDGLQFSMEAGKPGEPKVDGISFTLQNFDYTGAELYDDAWFDANSRTKLEGGLFPGQIFFKVLIPDTNASFIGVLATKKYSAYRNEVTIELKSLLELTRDNNLTMLKRINLGSCFLVDRRQSGETFINFGQDLNGAQIKAEQYEFSITDQGALNNVALHFAGADFYSLGSLTWSGLCYVKINEITLLVRVFLLKQTGLSYPDYIEMRFEAMANGNTETTERLILERGRFFRNADGDPLQEQIGYSVELLAADQGHSPNVMFKQTDFPGEYFIGGLPTSNFGGTGDFLVKESAEDQDYFKLIETTINVLQANLFSRYYPSPPSGNINTSSIQEMYAFYADIMQLGWIGFKTSEILVNISMAVNAYLFMNEQGKIVFQPRLLHASLPAILPAAAFEVQLEDIKPLSSQDASGGFDSYKIEYSDRIPLNNVEDKKQLTLNVDEAGVREEPALRSTDITVEIYRSDNLGVPAVSNGLPLLRRSPEDAAFPGLNDLADFLPTVETQGIAFAQSLTYPITTWNIQWNMKKYPNAGIGGYFWVDWPTQNRVYLIRKITHDAEKLLHKMEVQEVGTWNG